MGGNQLQQLLLQLDQSQWWPAEKMREYQLGQLRLVLRVAQQHVPYYRERLTQFAGAELTLEKWSRFPLLTRVDLLP